MNSPYKGKYRVSQEYKGNAHDGMDLIGVDSKNIYSTINGVVEIAGWENEDNKGQGFGMYIRIKQDNSNDKYYFGHLSAFKCKVGQIVKKGDLIGIEGNTGNSSGSHCHYCVRTNGDKTKHKDVSQLIGIPNEISIYEQIKDGWKKVDKLWYYYKDGELVKGWLKVKSKWYYLDKATAIMKTGWIISEGKKYYLNSSGTMITGWKKLGGEWYFFDKTNGDMRIGWLIDGARYYLLSTGIMVTGLQKIDGKVFYFKSSGALALGKITITVQTDKDGVLW